jgi:hypothetical protein
VKRKPSAISVAAEEPALRLRDLEDRVLHRDAEIGPLDEHEPAAHREAVDGGDDGLRQRAFHEGIVDRAAVRIRPAALDRLLHVLAGAEPAPRPGEDRDVEIVAILELPPCLGQRQAKVAAQRVEALGPVHADHEGLSVALGLDEGHAISFGGGVTPTIRRERPPSKRCHGSVTPAS